MLYKNNKKAFTLIEVVVAVAMAAGLLILVMKMFGYIRGDVAKGTVDLQNLQDARLVINSLRRDFTCAVPIYDSSESLTIRDEVRANPILKTSTFTKNQKSRPIIVSNTEINFGILDKSGNLNEVHYYFNPTTKTLNRKSSEGEKAFKGIENIYFELYYHPLKDKIQIPMLLVTILIKTKDSNVTRELPITTTMCSSVISKDIENLDWNWTSK